MVIAAHIDETGGPEVIRFADVTLPPPTAGEVRLRHQAIGINFVDIYYRSGLYPCQLPSPLGMEAAGIVEDIGPGVTHLKPGDRVATFGLTPGAYAQARNVPAAELFRLPDAISAETAAAAMLKGCTVEFLVERCAKVQPGMTVLVQAAAGGVGLLLVQWLKAVGATVIGTAGSSRKAQVATAAGADHVILYREADTAEEVARLTNGEGVDVVFDGVGATSWPQSLASARRRGLVVSYGNASGPVTGVAMRTLATAGSLFVTRPSLYDYYREAPERKAGAARLWAMLMAGKLAITIGQRWPLAQAAEAHRALEGRRTTGSSLLIP